ncbi:uncharacterized protein BO97DRAFT_441304 [Aspergillus homomorphus CBS 101889]|uniref:25D9-5p n=1 Tax=Aspergillus homomorphus (strain CBS 101889) TaxID=1450537 RepID=A0A395I6S7_ASPHC|nr:hypothetical protein BO97DRAFT_441304 [Aspergillus homomorphus CBS 101889]RAL14808.1 hypothetical protein BO97DRAFT_441304 [Aspergillus homomorphus CBS 101889]
MQSAADTMADPEPIPAHVARESTPSEQKDEGHAPTTTDPGQGSPSAGASPPPTAIPSPSPSLLRARRQLLAALRATDTTIERLDKLTTTAAGTERVLAVTGYLSHALHHLLASAPWLALQTRLSLLARLRRHRQHQHSSSPPKPPPTPPPTTPTTKPKPPLLALSSLMSETRFTLRLLGLLPLWTWGAATLRSPPKDRILYILTLLQVVVNMIYQVLENGSYLAAKGVVPRRFIERWGGLVQWDLWSTRAWFGHIFLQFFVLARERTLRLRRREELASSSGGGSGKGAKDAKLKDAEDEAEVRAWRKSLVNNVCWAPLCLHWCFEEGIGFPEHLTGLVSFMAGAWDFWDSWGRTGSSV